MMLYTFWTLKWLHLSDMGMFATENARICQVFGDLKQPRGLPQFMVVSKSRVIPIHIDGRNEEMQQRYVPKTQNKDASTIIVFFCHIFSPNHFEFSDIVAMHVVAEEHLKGRRMQMFLQEPLGV